jgi:hypothetical protein
MIVIKAYWGLSGSRKGATVCKDEHGYYVRYASLMKVVSESKRYKKLSTADKKAEQYCNVPL